MLERSFVLVQVPSEADAEPRICVDWQVQGIQAREGGNDTEREVSHHGVCYSAGTVVGN